MATYRVSLERNGEMILIGTIQGNRDSDMAFRYRQEYLDDPTAIPISQSLPSRKEDFARAAGDCGLRVKSAMKRMEDLRERFVPALKKAASELEKEQYPGVERRMEEILRHGGIRTLL